MGLVGQELKHSTNINSLYCMEQTRGALSTAWAQGETPQWQLLLLFMSTPCPKPEKKPCWDYIAPKCCAKMSAKTFADSEAGENWYCHFTDGKVRQNIHGCKKTFRSSSERILTSENRSVYFIKPFVPRDSTVLRVCFRCLQHLPELVCYEDDAALQQEGGEDADDLPHAEALEQALKVHVFQAGVHGPPQLDDLDTPNTQQSAPLGKAGSASVPGTQPGPPALPHACLNPRPSCKPRLQAQHSRKTVYCTIPVMPFFPEYSCVHCLLSSPREA